MRAAEWAGCPPSPGEARQEGDTRPLTAPASGDQPGLPASVQTQARPSGLISPLGAEDSNALVNSPVTVMSSQAREPLEPHNLHPSSPTRRPSATVSPVSDCMAGVPLRHGQRPGGLERAQRAQREWAEE